MMCKVRNPSRRVGWRSRERGAVGRRAAVRGFHDALDQVVSKEFKWVIGCLVCTAWWTLALVFCRSAYAAPSVEIDGNFAGYENNETYNGYVVVDAPNEYIATLTLIGEYASLPQIDSDMYAKLSNESSGGRFYELVQQWQVMGTNASGTAGNYPTWAGSTYFIDGLNTVYGYGHVWECAITDSLKAGAKEDFLTILGGGNLGGGGGNIPSVPNEINWQYAYYTGNGNEWAGEKIKVEFSNDSVKSVFIEKLRVNNIDHYGYFAFEGNINTRWFWVVITDGELVYTDGKLSGWKNNSNSSTSIINYGVYGSYDEINNIYTITGINTGYPHNVNSGGTYSLSNSVYFTDKGDGVNGGDDEPGDNNWPDDDTPTPPSENPPNPPTITPPSSPTPPTITPYNPTNPTPPTNTTPPTGTTPTDYTPWLQAILQQLINLTSYLETCFTWLGTVLEEHCQHIRDHMTTCSQFLGDYVVGGMSSLLGEHHTFLNGLAQWIVDNLRWENSGGEFDDSNMIYWLRRIYARQGAGDVNTRPVDPATDYSGFAGWLGVLYDAVALDVSDTSLTALTSSLSGLQHTFPFSLPWDVKQVLQALDVSPVTPSASIPSGTTDVSYDVDLHWMDSAMVSVRAFELLVFIVYVMVHTRDLFGYLMGE